MITAVVEHPTELWLLLGKTFFKFGKDHIDVRSGFSKFISIENTFVIRVWPVNFTGKDLMRSVGYIDGGGKMAMIRNKYVDEDKFLQVRQLLKEKKSDGKAVSFQFKQSLEGAGGCLMGMDFVRTEGEWNRVFVHAKVMEIPKKFTADLVFLNSLFHELGLTFPLTVVVNVSTIFFSPTTLQGYLLVMPEWVKKKNCWHHDFTSWVDGYQEPTQHKIQRYQKSLSKITRLNIKGEWDG